MFLAKTPIEYQSTACAYPFPSKISGAVKEEMKIKLTILYLPEKFIKL